MGPVGSTTAAIKDVSDLIDVIQYDKFYCNSQPAMLNFDLHSRSLRKNLH
jgi:hypothetical protein